MLFQQQSELITPPEAVPWWGDGAFQMNIQELEWVKRENLPITMMVMNNHALGMIRHLQRDYFEQVYADTSEGRLLVLQLHRGSQSLWNQQCLYGSQ